MAATETPEPSPPPAGGAVLSLIAGPLCVPILRAHLDGALRLPDLHQRIPGATQTGLRSQVEKLRSIRALMRRVPRRMPYTVENELSRAGHGFLGVADVVERWLSRYPDGPIPLGSDDSKRAIGALLGGWESTVLHALAARPLSLTELNGVVPDVSYPSIGRRLSAMRATRQVEALALTAGSKPQIVTEWGRRAVAPLLSAGRCERVHLEGTTEALTRLDLEAGFMLAAPLISLPVEQSGRCLLAVDPGGSAGTDVARHGGGVFLEIEHGEAAVPIPDPEREPSAWALGTAEAWVEAMVDGRFGDLEVGGEEPRLAQAVIAELHAAL